MSTEETPEDTTPTPPSTGPETREPEEEEEEDEVDGIEADRAGGELPDVGAVLSTSLSHMAEQLAPYALAGLGYFVATFVLVFGTFIVFYALLIAAAVGMVVLVAVAEEAMGDAGALLGTLVGSVGIFAVSGIGIAAIAAVMAPINASLYRGVRAQQRGESPLTFASAFNRATENLPQVLLTTSMMYMLVTLGFFFFVVPGLLAAFAFHLAPRLAALHDCSAREALRLSAQHAKEYPAWHGIYFGASILIGSFSGYVPVLGPMFVFQLDTLIYREIYGDGDTPTIEGPLV